MITEQQLKSHYSSVFEMSPLTLFYRNNLKVCAIFTNDRQLSDAFFETLMVKHEKEILRRTRDELTLIDGYRYIRLPLSPSARGYRASMAMVDEHCDIKTLLEIIVPITHLSTSEDVGVLRRQDFGLE